ncbi:MAG: Mth938-like domain-containing protein [Longimonas sp.]|uniref:Mth938-like domain-containing protein n=1 Tax=Longimonas sp. TaxID=2039626 RepID=UPI0039771DD2
MAREAPDEAPEIESVSWGSVTVAGIDQSFRDAKLYPGGARAWDWNETGTHHTPGIQPADVRELIDHGAEAVVLAQGFHERLQVKDETLDWLREQDVDTHVLDTEAAVARYNDLRTTQPAGALIHSTC